MTIDHKAIDREILAKLDLRAVAESWGVRFEGTPTGKGWLGCYAIDRDESNPSAGLCIASDNGSLGRYKDHGSGDAKSLSFFDVGVKLGKYATWQDARVDLATKAGVELPKSKGQRTWQTVAAWWERRLAAKLAGHWMYRTAESVESFVVARFDLAAIDATTGKTAKEFRPIHRGADGSWKTGDPKGPLPLYRLPTLPEAKRVYLPEGEKAADALAALALTATTSAHGSKSAHKTDFAPLAGKDVVLVPDVDKAGERFAADVAGLLAKLTPAPTVRVVKLPDLPPAGDAVEFIAAGRGVGRADAELAAEIEALANAAAPIDLATVGATSAKDHRPTIALSTDEHLHVTEGIEALASDPDVYQRGGQLVDVANDSLPRRRGIKAPEAPRIVPIPEARLRTRLSSRARFVKNVDSSAGMIEVAQHPPGWLVKGTAAAGRWPGVRHLEAVVTSPIMRHDGSILQTPGYDAESGILYAPRRAYPEIPDVPLPDEICLAVEALNEVVEDFPFERAEHRAGWFAATFTPIARFAFEGPAPLFLVEANVRGAGKGLATDAAGIIATGNTLATANYSHDDAEMRKVITSIAMAGDRAVLLDNIGGAFGLPSLDSALTSTKWKDRVLGLSRTVEVPLVVTWYATANNVMLTGDIVRRICHIRLNSPEEAPEEREGFRHAELRGWLHQEHPRLLAAALTILRGYVAAGRPDMQLRAWGSFEGWSALVRNAVVWARLPDPGATRHELAKQSDADGAQLRALLAGWQEIDPSGRGLTVGEVFERLGEPGVSTFPTLRAALNESCTGRKGERPTAKALQYKLRHYRRRVVGKQWFDTQGEVRGAAVWKVMN